MFSGGSGTIADPYLISNLTDLNNIRNYLSAHYALTTDIDASDTETWNSGAGWIPIGIFNGSIEGMGYKISGLYINSTSDQSGLFVGSGSGVVHQLGLVNIDITGANYVGAFGGLVRISVSECFCTGVITGNLYVGGIAGYLFTAGMISNCQSFCTVTGTQHVGGLVGRGYQSQINNAYSVGLVIGSNDTGGMIGSIASDVTTISSYWNTDSSGQLTSASGSGKTTSEMRNRPTFVDWDFSGIWKIDSYHNSGYPYFIWQNFIINEYIPNYPPASKIKLNFKSGDSDPLLMGIFYVDRTNFAVGRANVSVDARNSVGKYLKDQTFDERNIYAKQQIQLLLAQILTGMGITNYYVGTETTELGMEFSPSQDILSGINDVLTTIRDWQVREEPDGKVVVAERTDTAFTQPGTYTFYRNRDVFSRSVTKDDNNTYGRVCVHTSDFSVKAYRPVSSDLGWLPPAQKTLYQQCPDGTTSIAAAALATEIAEQLSNSGEVEEFVGPIRPQLMPGDGAQIVDEDGPRLVGTITTVTHQFGKDGFYTQFTVDSGGKINKPLLSDYLKQISAGTVKSKIIS